jgi:hypothetical protein
MNAASSWSCHGISASRDALDLLLQHPLPRKARPQFAFVQPWSQAALPELLREIAHNGLVLPVVTEEDVEFRDLLLAAHNGRGGRFLPTDVGRFIHRQRGLVRAGRRFVLVAQRDPFLADRTKDGHPAAVAHLLHLLASERRVVVRAGVLTFPDNGADYGPSHEMGMDESFEPGSGGQAAPQGHGKVRSCGLKQL